MVAAVYLFVTCYTTGFTLETVADNTEMIGLRNYTSNPSYDPFYQSRVKKQQAGSNITRSGLKLFQNKWDEEGSCFIHFVTIFPAFFIMLGLTAFIICYSYG